MSCWLCSYSMLFMQERMPTPYAERLTAKAWHPADSDGSSGWQEVGKRLGVTAKTRVHDVSPLRLRRSKIDSRLCFRLVVFIRRLERSSWFVG